MTSAASTPALRVDTRGKNELPPHLNENLLTPRFYVTEFNKASKTNLDDAREEFEAMFINQMLKQARDSKLSDALFSSDEEDNFGAMLDQERSRSLALNLDLGIAEALVRQFDKNNKE